MFLSECLFCYWLKGYVNYNNCTASSISICVIAYIAVLPMVEILCLELLVVENQPLNAV